MAYRDSFSFRVQLNRRTTQERPGYASCEVLSR
jgi:hypothetical protein